MPVADRVAQSQYPRAIATTTALLINSHTARCGWCYAYDTVAGSPEKADFILQFADSEQGVKTLLKGDPTAFMTGMQDGSIKMEGDFSLLVWFNQAAKLIPPKLPKPVKDKVRQARAFIKEKTGR
nr:hypothetical protein [Acinetobacter baumannii]